MPSMFETLADNATSPLQPLVYCIRTTRINNPSWTVASWSVIGLAVRTNNDVEGWHNLFNSIGSNINFYKLIEVLHRGQVNQPTKPACCPKQVIKIVAKLGKVRQRYKTKK
ncbi:hypothetical protein O3P69_018897 [Scylla paramamosain]|uniref:Uncharacterized protein n=1 Tax=Scylla paramamosain TaxID=85552 RepID=A0AAW0SBP3_SCYPA